MYQQCLCWLHEKPEVRVSEFSPWPCHCHLPGTRASGKPASCRTWSRTGRSRLCRTTSFCFTSNSKSPNNSQWDSGVDERALCVYVCVHLTVCEQLRMQIEGISTFGAPCLSVSLGKSLSYVKRPLNDLVGNKRISSKCLFGTFEPPISCYASTDLMQDNTQKKAQLWR